MAKKRRDTITNTLGVEPVEINSALVSAQKGGNLKQYFERKRRQLVFELIENGKIKVRKLTSLECERLQTLPDNYTKYGLFDDDSVKQISDTQRYKCIGNGWAADVISWIFSFMKYGRTRRKIEQLALF